MQTKINHPLKDYLTNKKITITSFSKRLNINRSYLYLILKKKNIPSPALAKKISELTGISVTKLLYPEDDDV